MAAVRNWLGLFMVAYAVTAAAATRGDSRGSDGGGDRLAIEGLLAGRFQWTISDPLVSPADRPEDPCYSVKDPSVVFHAGRWHLFCTIRSQKRSHQIEYLTFTDWKDANSARRQLLKPSDGFFCAPQVFYFAPQKKWYLICQASDDSWEPKYGAAYSTTRDIADPNSWSKLKPLGARQAEGKSGLDFWVICDEKKAHLFFTTLDGRMWREETRLEDFPGGWSEAKLAIQGDIFEASHTYKLKGLDKYLTVVEAQGGHGWRYFKAYLADRLDGPWTPLAATKDKTFASMANARPAGRRWTDSISHGELLRAGVDQRLEVDPANLRFLFQGVSDQARGGKPYGQIPWRLGILAPENPPRVTMLIEAERFANYGGWVLDPQFMDQMGSPYLLAHGLGSPVADATTSVELPQSGRYRVLVRTMDWVARWKAPGAPGKFQLLVDGKPLPTTFGAEGEAWHWQEGGWVDVPNRRVRLALKDLTGFEGRCDAIVLTTDPQLTPPNRDPRLAAFRRELLGLPEKPEPGGTFDLVAVGGGMAGTCAAIGAARLGLKAALVQDRPVLGGNNSSEVRVWLQGARNVEPWPRVGDIVRQLEQKRHAHYGPANTAELYEDQRKLALARAEPNLKLLLEHRANDAVCEGKRIKAVIAQDLRSGRRLEIAGRWFADCTGDAGLGALAGADFELTPKGHMGPCNLWHVVDTRRAVSFPRCPWALDLSNKPFPGRKGPDILKLGGWYWESGFDRHPIDEMEYVRDWNFRAMYGAWDALKNVDRSLPNHRLNWSAYILGKRESRRLMGDLVLTKADLVGGKSYPDGCVPTGWQIDLHLPDPRYARGFEGDAFIAEAHYTRYPTPYWIPYRCLYSRNVPNLFMAGRDISVTHEALGAVRVMRTGGMMGEIVGMAASLCRQHDCDPRQVYQQHLAELQGLMRRGVGR